tara:strand:- start:382 stop:1113 length:732 start_codon:yes stop_codon:yes gene_type:complete
MFSIHHNSISICKPFFKLFNNIIDQVACIINEHGIHIKSSNHKFVIHSVLDNWHFDHYKWKSENIVQISIRDINRIFDKHDTYSSIQIVYKNRNCMLFILNKTNIYSIPCSIINNKDYIHRILNVDDLDYSVEFDIEPKYIYSILSTIKKKAKTITITSNPKTQDIFINNIKLEHSSLYTYLFILSIHQTFSIQYIHQFIKNCIRNKYKSILLGLYPNKSMKMLLYLDDLNYIEYYIRPLKSC